MRKALVVGTDHSLEVVDLGETSEETSKALNTAVGGWYQAVDINPTLTLWCNEEGKIHGLPINTIATKVFQARFGAYDVIMGNVIFTGGADEEGETVGLTEDQMKQLEFMFS